MVETNKGRFDHSSCYVYKRGHLYESKLDIVIFIIKMISQNKNLVPASFMKPFINTSEDME